MRLPRHPRWRGRWALGPGGSQAAGGPLDPHPCPGTWRSPLASPRGLALPGVHCGLALPAACRGKQSPEPRNFASWLVGGQGNRWQWRGGEGHGPRRAARPARQDPQIPLRPTPSFVLSGDSSLGSGSAWVRRTGPSVGAGLQRALQMEAVEAAAGPGVPQVPGPPAPAVAEEAPSQHRTPGPSCLLSIPADAFDNDLMHRTLKNIVEGKTVEVPTYDFVTHSR